MLVSVIPIGNSKGIRLPKAILEQLHIQDTLELEIEDKRLVLRPVARIPRDGWEAALSAMSARGEDALLVPDATAREALEWEW